MSNWFDAALYPDQDSPKPPETLSEQVDFLCRVCAAWDFGILPHQETITEIRRTTWREAVAVCNLLTSPSYHLLREWHQLEPCPYLGQELAYIRDDPWLSFV